jgi:hypothetical protein
MPTPLTLSIGNVTLHGFEIPDKHFGPLGGEQLVAVHRFPGGTKTVQALGAFPTPIGWSGIIIGADAFTRTKQLDRLRVTGQVQTIQYGPWQYVGIVTKFEAAPENAWYVPYTIEIEPIVDTSGHTSQAAVIPTPEARLSSTIQDVQARASSQMSPLQTAVPAVLPGVLTLTTDVQKALYGNGGQIGTIPTSQITSLQNEIAASVANLNVVASGGPSCVGTTGGLLVPGKMLFYRIAPVIGGVEQSASPETSILPGAGQTAVTVSWQALFNAPAYRVYRGRFANAGHTYYTTLTPAFTDLGNPGLAATPVLAIPLTPLSSGAQIAEAQALLDRLSLVSSLLGGVAPALAVLAVVNPSLVALASAYYGDATQWPRIAAANGLLDPQPIGTFPSLVVPH